MHRTRHLRLPPAFDVARLKRDLATIGEAAWIPHFNTADYEGSWRCVPLRSEGGRSDHILSLPDTAYADTPILARCPYFREVLDTFACEKASVRLMAMAADARIHVHRDHGTGFGQGTARLHIPIVTAPAVLFTIDGEAVHFPAGETWYMNADCPHGVHNGSPGPRIHLMMDCIVNPWLQRMFAEAGFVPDEAPKYGDAAIDDGNVAQVIAALRRPEDPAAEELASRLEAMRKAGPQA